MKATFYGHFSGFSSYPTVCRAIANYLHESQDGELELCDLRPQGTYERLGHIRKVPDMLRQQIMILAQLRERSQEHKEGIGLTFGFPQWTKHVPRHDINVGYHVCDLDVIPKEWVEDMNNLDAVLTPSVWCAEVFRHCGVRIPIRGLPHGVRDYEPRSKPEGPFTFVHFCSAQTPDRKGTLKLLQAFFANGLDAKLEVYTDSPIVKKAAAKLSDIRVSIHSQDFTRQEDQYERYGRAHVVVQPSRAEGFGMIPLEALACGTPVVATACTGHAEFLPLPGAEIVPTTDRLENCPPGPGKAPNFDVDTLRSTLLSVYDKYDTLRREAMTSRDDLKNRWGWEEVLSPLDSLSGV